MTLLVLRLNVTSATHGSLSVRPSPYVTSITGAWSGPASRIATDRPREARTMISSSRPGSPATSRTSAVTSNSQIWAASPDPGESTVAQARLPWFTPAASIQAPPSAAHAVCDPAWT
ncbi:MAG: hypothetical protein FJX36_01615 [Alphaproteobacteria bacterium]|nr:hypothetical protein [Alphaproteobacteria bacterium]